MRIITYPWYFKDPKSRSPTIHQIPSHEHFSFQNTTKQSECQTTDAVDVFLAGSQKF